MSDVVRKKVVILGSTGSIGTSALKVARDVPERMEVVGLAAGNNVDLLIEQALEFSVKHVSVNDPNQVPKVKKSLGSDVEVHAGSDGLLALSELPESDMVLVSIVGTAGLAPTLTAIEHGKDIALASKEVLVMAGEIVMARAREKGVKVLPVDSEHNALFQCLEGHQGGDKEIRRLILTASGGPFRDPVQWPAEKLSQVQLADALKHPTWTMGRKITLDSATLFNKALEMIEARWLFDVEMAKVDVIVHHQSIVHSMVEFTDHSILAQMSQTDMCFPIQYAITYPDRVPNGLKPLNFAELAELTFVAPRREDFPALDLAMKAGTIGGTLPAVLNASNEIAVQSFIDGKISFPQIWGTVAQAMDSHVVSHPTNLDGYIQADLEAREVAMEIIG